MNSVELESIGTSAFGLVYAEGEPGVSDFPLPPNYARDLLLGSYTQSVVFFAPLAFTEPSLDQPLPIDARDRLKAGDLIELEDVASAFAEHAARRPFVQEVWASGDHDEITVVASEHDLDQELHLHAIFIDLATSTLSDPARGELTVVTAPWEPEDNTKLLFRR